MAYEGSVDLISGIRPKNNGTFPLVDAKDVRVTDTKRLSDALNDLEGSFVRYDSSQSLTTAQKQTARENIGVEAELTDLKEGLSDGMTVVSDEIFTKDNVLLTASYAETALNPSGYVRTNSNFNTSQFVPITGYAGLVTSYSLSISSDYVTIAFFASNTFGNPLRVIPRNTKGTVYAIPDGANYAVFTYPSTGEYHCYLLTGKIVDVESIAKDAQDSFAEIAEKGPDSKQLYDNSNPSIFNGYCNGAAYFSSGAHRILYIQCKPNTVYTISADETLWKTYGVFTSEEIPKNGNSAMPFSASSDAITNIENGRRYITNSTASDAKYIAVAYYNSNTAQSATEEEIRTTVMIAEGSDRTQYIPYALETKIKESVLPELTDVAYDHTITSKASTLTTGQKIEFLAPNIKKNNILSFHAVIDTFGKLTIGQGRDALNQTAYIVIDATTVKVYRYATAPIEWISLDHGLTIADYIDVSIVVSNSEIGWAKLTVTSNGETYTYGRMAWLGTGNVAYAEATNGSYKECVFIHSCNDYDKKVWALGDSYFDHWVTHVLEDGYKNFLCDGWSGRKSAQALTSLNILLKHGKPHFIVWCMGMNDGDSSSAVNTNWKNSYDELVNICEANNIKPILCTIPNTPSVNNKFKNNIIRNSGYDYIELAKAVGSDISTSWYTGLLSTDNVHPSTLGDQIIAKFMETALPQIFGE